MTRKSTLDTLNGQISRLVFSPRKRQMTYVTDANEYAIVHCSYQQMAERVAQTEGLPLEVWD